MTNDRRMWMIVAFVVVSLAILLMVSGRIAELLFPPPPLADSGFEIQPGGAATPGNFARLRPGMARHEVLNILGPSEGIEGGHAEWWDGPDFSIDVRYNDGLTSGGEIVFRDGRKSGMGK